MCDDSGSALTNDKPYCDSRDGQCRCKEKVEGKQCDKCKPGHYNLDFYNEWGCTQCFCYGHFKSCDRADGYHEYNITSDFASGDVEVLLLSYKSKTLLFMQGWTGQVALSEGGMIKQVIPVEDDENTMISVASNGQGAVYFVAPEKYLGNQRASYNQFLLFDLKVTKSPRDHNEVRRALERCSAAFPFQDVVIEGTNGQKLTTALYNQENPQHEEGVVQVLQTRKS